LFSLVAVYFACLVSCVESLLAGGYLVFAALVVVVAEAAFGPASGFYIWLAFGDALAFAVFVDTLAFVSCVGTGALACPYVVGAADIGRWVVGRVVGLVAPNYP
jgi:hypothetical protein